jgi:hypothetical protein
MCLAYIFSRITVFLVKHRREGERNKIDEILFTGSFSGWIDLIYPQYRKSFVGYHRRLINSLSEKIVNFETNYQDIQYIHFERIQSGLSIINCGRGALNNNDSKSERCYLSHFPKFSEKLC